MRKRFVLFLVTILLLCGFCLCPLGYQLAQAWPTGSSWSEHDFTVPGTVQFQTTVYASGHDSGATTLASTVTPLGSANIAFGLIQLANGSPGIHDIPDGVTGKVIIIELLANPAYIFGDDTATTKTGWVTISLDTVHDRIVLLWLDDSTGWIIINNDGCSITY